MTYDPDIHSHVTHRDFRAPRVIVHATSARVWVEASYDDQIAGGIVVSDGLAGWPFDDHGRCLLSIPIGDCTFWTNEGASLLIEAIAA